MAKQKFRPTRLGGFPGAKAYIRYVEVLKKRRNAVGRTFCDAITIDGTPASVVSNRYTNVLKNDYFLVFLVEGGR
jgi:hypothetical protein